MDADPDIVILGAGIGGLTLAAHLQSKGIRCRIYEQAEQLGEVGAGIGLWSNAVSCLEQIGIDETFWSTRGCEIFQAEIASSSGKVLSRCDVRPVVEKIGTGSFVVHRGDLHRAIAQQVAPDSIQTGKQLVDLKILDDGVRLRFADGAEETAGIAVGADGLRSQTRASLFGEIPPRYSGQTCYRGIAKKKIGERHVLREIQGRGPRAAVIPLDDERVYWWTTENTPESGNRPPHEEKSHLLSLYDDWAFGVADVIEATPAESILRNDLYDRPPLPTWSRGPVTLLGDAAHPTTPNLGQGACMAIEDAFFLGTLLADSGKPATAFSQYEKLRKSHCESIVKASRRFGWIGGWSHPLAVGLREMMMASTPEFMVRKTMEKNLTPAPLPRTSTSCPA
ncbi:FAD-dependent monooxygenase [Verrucomicrobiales bacterium BCK34]|nr:FAD-dependent monooxygenase [Verrucomicrobiales bacterium BCK34]